MLCNILQGTINYWCRCGHYRHAINAAEEGLKTYANDPFLKFIIAFGMMMEGNLYGHFSAQLTFMERQIALQVAVI